MIDRGTPVPGTGRLRVTTTAHGENAAQRMNMCSRKPVFAASLGFDDDKVAAARAERRAAEVLLAAEVADVDMDAAFVSIPTADALALPLVAACYDSGEIELCYNYGIRRVVSAVSRRRA